LAGLAGCRNVAGLAASRFDPVSRRGGKPRPAVPKHYLRPRKRLFAANWRLTMINPDANRTAQSTHPAARRRALHAIAIFEAVKGLAALAAIIGVIDLMHQDLRHLAIDLIGRFGQNPESRYASIILHYADLLPNADLRALSLLAAAYILVRLSEAYGLWNDLAWGEWLGALSGALYIPFEIKHLLNRPSFISAAVCVGNVVIVAFLAFQLWRRRRTTIAAP
jgi:uncharacterized membrane protein (DUF2068 family)